LAYISGKTHIGLKIPVFFIIQLIARTTKHTHCRTKYVLEIIEITVRAQFSEPRLKGGNKLYNDSGA
jgi:hypothetical protein